MWSFVVVVVATQTTLAVRSGGGSGDAGADCVLESARCNDATYTIRNVCALHSRADAFAIAFRVA